VRNSGPAVSRTGDFVVWVTVAICTWNRAALLDATLGAMEQLVIPSDVDWELLVVDNNCTDGTASVISKHASSLPVRVLQERRQGLSHARNCAAEAARGDLVLWTDDDALVDPHWLEEYVRAGEQHRDAMFSGGPVEPWFAAAPPRWLEANFAVFAGAYALRRLPAGTIVLDREELLPFGANFAVRKKGLEVAKFDTSLGRTGDDFMGGEEVDFLGRLLGGGYFGIWVEHACVRHFIPAERLTGAYLWGYYQGKGRTQLRLARVAERPPLWRLRRKYWKARARAWANRFGRGERWARALKASWITKGMIDELRSGG
jgi:glycosyltransferase involved in cell wall biosynthesis